MEQYTRAKLFERRQEDLDAVIRGNILAMINYFSAKKLGENIWKIKMSRTVDSEGKLVDILE